MVKSEGSFSNKMLNGICGMKNSSGMVRYVLVPACDALILEVGMLETRGKNPVPVA